MYWYHLTKTTSHFGSEKKLLPVSWHRKLGDRLGEYIITEYRQRKLNFLCLYDLLESAISSWVGSSLETGGHEQPPERQRGKRRGRRRGRRRRRRGRRRRRRRRRSIGRVRSRGRGSRSCRSRERIRRIKRRGRRKWGRRRR